MSAPVQSCQPIPEPVRQHTPTPWKVEGMTLCVVSDHAPKGRMRVADLRGWGYLTGKGDGALGLSDDEAFAIQEANANLIANTDAAQPIGSPNTLDHLLEGMTTENIHGEFGAAVQAKLLADTGRRVEAMEKIAADCEEASKIYITQAGRSLSTERVSDIYRRLSVSIRAALSSGEAGK